MSKDKNSSILIIIVPYWGKYFSQHTHFGISLVRPRLFNHVSRLDQSRAREKIWWIITLIPRVRVTHNVYELSMRFMTRSRFRCRSSHSRRHLHHMSPEIMHTDFPPLPPNTTTTTPLPRWLRIIRFKCPPNSRLAGVNTPWLSV